VVVQDESAPRDGRVIEVLGQYNPLLNPSIFNIDKDKTLNWLSKGAQPTEKARILLGKAGILPPVDLASLPKRKPRKEAAEEAPAEKKEEVKEEKKEEAKEEKKEEVKEEKKEQVKEEAKAEAKEQEQAQEKKEEVKE
jgi:small subunit ribosomal protein S16